MKKYAIKSLILLMMLFMIVSCRNPIENNLTVNKFTVTFDSMGGSLVSSAEVIENLLATEPTAPTKTGYTFGGWYKEDTLTNKWDFTTDKVTGNITLYAKWIADAVSCTVTYESNNGTAVSPATEEVGKTIISPTATTKVGYTFVAWYKEANFTTQWNFVTDIVAGDMTLYAKWKASEILVEAGTAGTSGITTTKSFYIHQFEVTQSQYEELMLYNPSEFLGKPNNPVEKVTWYDAIAYANNLSDKEGFEKFYNISGITKTGNNITSATVTENSGAKGYRLPTLNERKYAARGGNFSQNFTYAGSNNVNDVAWIWDNNTTNGEIYGTKEIGRKTPNELGIYDMSGNVWEWADENSILGGTWTLDQEQAQLSFTQQTPKNGYGKDLGFRLVRDY